MDMGFLERPQDLEDVAACAPSQELISPQACFDVARLSSALSAARRDGFSVAFSDGNKAQKAMGLWLAEVRTSSIDSRTSGTAVLIRPVEPPADMLDLEPCRPSNVEVPSNPDVLTAMDRIRGALDSLAGTRHPIFVKCARGTVWNLTGAELNFKFDAQAQELTISACRDGKPIRTLPASLMALSP